MDSSGRRIYGRTALIVGGLCAAMLVEHGLFRLQVIRRHEAFRTAAQRQAVNYAGAERIRRALDELSKREARELPDHQWYTRRGFGYPLAQRVQGAMGPFPPSGPRAPVLSPPLTSSIKPYPATYPARRPYRPIEGIPVEEVAPLLGSAVPLTDLGGANAQELVVTMDKPGVTLSLLFFGRYLALYEVKPIAIPARRLGAQWFPVLNPYVRSMARRLVPYLWVASIVLAIWHRGSPSAVRRFTRLSLAISAGTCLILLVAGLPGDPAQLTQVMLRGRLFWFAIMALFSTMLVLLLPREPRDVMLCFECGYSLIGNLSGICPECGTPIPPSPIATQSTDLPASLQSAAARS
jgi:hypothetical protein